MRRFKNGSGDWVTDQKNYYVVCSNDDFGTETDAEDFWTDWNKARSYAIKMSRTYKAAEIRCEKYIYDEDFYDGMVTIWSECYENGKKIYRRNWRI